MRHLKQQDLNFRSMNAISRTRLHVFSFHKSVFSLPLRALWHFNLGCCVIIIVMLTSFMTNVVTRVAPITPLQYSPNFLRLTVLLIAILNLKLFKSSNHRSPRSPQPLSFFKTLLPPFINLNSVIATTFIPSSSTSQTSLRNLISTITSRCVAPR